MGGFRAEGRKSGVNRSGLRDNISGMATGLHFGQRYRVIAPHAIASQFNESHTGLVTDHDRAIPVGTVFRLGDAFEWNPYSQPLTKDSLNPNFYEITFEGHVSGFVSQHAAVLARALETSVEEIDNLTAEKS